MPGSFSVSRDQLEQQIREQRKVEEFKKTVENQPAATEDTGPKLPPEIQAKLPEFVLSDIYGKLPYADFKARYENVWNQVVNKEYLTQRVQYTTKLGPFSVRVRSFTKREQKALTMFEPVGSAVSEDPAKFRDQQMEYAVLRLIVQIEQLGDVAFPDLKLTPETRESWRNDSSVKQRYELLMDLDPMDISHLMGVLNDLDQAKYYALIENIGNP